MKKEIHVVGAIIVKENRILCCKRGLGRSLANLWEFPGGKIENGESKIEALKRELAEELKIKVSIVEEEFEFCRYEYEFGFVNLTTFICNLEEGTPQLTEHLEISWLPTNQLNTLEWAPADVSAVNKLIEKGLG